jgi:nucleoside 2-deoxyribosyltransferase
LASTPEEFGYYLISLKKRGLLELGKTLDYQRQVIISPSGWDYLEEKASKINEKTQAFVAMSFSEEMKPIWENALKEAITEAGYKAYRIDAEPHIDRIDAKIVTEIKNSRFLVADVTQQKHGVYFEAGYALGLGLPVIWCVRKDDLENVHFDTRQYNHIVWESEEQLREQLYNVICAVVGKGRAS